MQELSEEKVQELVSMFRINYATDSPFRGLLDMGFIFGIPIAHQNQIWEAIPEDIKHEMSKAADEGVSRDDS
jgi:hypothetical protein